MCEKTTNDDLSAATPIDTVSYQYTYEKDQLTAFDGKYITYDSDGNTLSFDGWNFTWQNKQLAGTAKGSDTISYQYNNSKIRTSKTVNGVTTNYTLDDDKNITSQTNGTDTINYTYDSDGKLQFMTLNGTKYTYETNSRDDVTGLLDSSGNEVVTYQYDSWGKLLNIGGSLKDTVGVKNPFRYRGYYYDTETGLYYLQSRYYNPEIGRFISKDDTSYHSGEDGVAANLYAYGNNNPVMNSDPDGHFIHIVISIAANLFVWAFWKLVIYRDHSWHTRDTIDVIAAIVSGIVGWWGSYYLRVRASKFAWGVYIGLKSYFVSWAWHGMPRKSIVLKDLGQVLVSAGIGVFA